MKQAFQSNHTTYCYSFKAMYKNSFPWNLSQGVPTNTFVSATQHIRLRRSRASSNTRNMIWSTYTAQNMSVPDVKLELSSKLRPQSAQCLMLPLQSCLTLRHADSFRSKGDFICTSSELLHSCWKQSVNSDSSNTWVHFVSCLLMECA